MKIYYLTTAQDSDSFKELLSKWSISPNLSNQNFHNKLIRAIAISHDVNVISVRPINKHFSQKSLQNDVKIENNVVWNYIKVSSSKLDKLLCVSNRIMGACKAITNNDVLFVDTMNLTLLKQANKIKEKTGCKIIGVCTDNPHNISFTSNSYKEKILNLGRKADSFIALTPKINELYNLNNKPFILIDGITESNIKHNQSIHIDTDYIYFGGSLMRKYGVYNLIEAFESLKRDDLKLVICGHHEENDLKETIKGKNIEYLGALPYEEICELENNAICAINPRPIDPLIDEYSIPSKTLEYMANGTIAITVKNDLLKDRYSEAILWADSGDANDLEEAIKKALNLSKKERELFIKNSLETVNKFTSFEAINKEVNKLL